MSGDNTTAMAELPTPLPVFDRFSVNLARVRSDFFGCRRPFMRQDKREIVDVAKPGAREWMARE
jgi:hypothetical protein